MKKQILWCLLSLSLFVIKVGAQDLVNLEETRVINRAVTYGVGHTNVLDTYLSPQEYKGIEFRVARESNRMTKIGDGNWSIHNFLQANIGYTHNYIDNNNALSGLLNWNYGLHYNFRISPNFKILAGGLLDANLGFVYNLRNGNNPASAKLYLNFAPSGMAIWDTRIKRLPLTLRYQINVPLMGVMFSPHYGQSYYEIFSLGNRTGVVKFTSLHNEPSLRQFISADIPFKHVKMRFSYIMDIQQSKLNKIKTHTYSQVFMVGFVSDLIKIKPRKSYKTPQNLRAY